MNFTTNLPKNKPRVTYIVASAEKSKKKKEEEKIDNFVYRMHAVVLYWDGSKNSNNNLYILCHIRKLFKKDNSE